MDNETLSRDTQTLLSKYATNIQCKKSLSFWWINNNNYTLTARSGSGKYKNKSMWFTTYLFTTVTLVAVAEMVQHVLCPGVALRTCRADAATYYNIIVGIWVDLRTSTHLRLLPDTHCLTDGTTSNSSQGAGETERRQTPLSYGVCWRVCDAVGKAVGKVMTGYTEPAFFWEKIKMVAWAVLHNRSPLIDEVLNRQHCHTALQNAWYANTCFLFLGFDTCINAFEVASSPG